MINQILSHKEEAKRVATQLGDELSTLAHLPQINYTNVTNLKGNMKAHEIVKLNHQTIKAFVSALENDIENIRTVATEFERIDHQFKYDITTNNFK